MALLANTATPKAEEILREQLIDREHSDSFKREVLACLKAIGAQEPYVAFLGKALVQVRVGEMEHLQMPKAYQTVLEEASSKLITEYGQTDPHAGDFAAQVWIAYVESLGSAFPRLTSAPWIGAIDALYMIMHNMTVDWKELSEKYDATEKTLKLRVRKLKGALESFYSR
jgi:hypothetical protein